MNYHFSLPGSVIWTMHIIIGIFLMYIGYMLLNNKKIHQLYTLALIILGSLGTFYHLHIWWVHQSSDKHSDLD